MDKTNQLDQVSTTIWEINNQWVICNNQCSQDMDIKIKCNQDMDSKCKCNQDIDIDSNKCNRDTANNNFDLI